jgi:hypothetical protein
MIAAADILAVVALGAILAIALASVFVAFKGKATRWVFLQCAFVVAAFALLEVQISGRGSVVLAFLLAGLFLIVCAASAVAGLLGGIVRRRAFRDGQEFRESIQ